MSSVKVERSCLDASWAFHKPYHVDVLPYIQHEADYEKDTSLDSVIRNPNKCIKCRRCVDICGKVQTVHNLSMANRGRDIMVVPEMGKPMAESACVRCGHCVDVCPVGAIYMQEHKDEMLYFAHSYDTDVAAQVSDDVIPELAKLFKVDENEITLGKIAAALHKVGVKTVVSDEHAKYTSAKQAAEIIEKKIGNADYVINARELYRIFLRTGGAPHKRTAMTLDKTWADGDFQYEVLLGCKAWNLDKGPEEVAIIVNGKPHKCAVAHNLGQVRKLLEGDYKNYDVVRLMA